MQLERKHVHDEVSGVLLSIFTSLGSCTLCNIIPLES